jgi:site-specific recombinase XerD
MQISEAAKLWLEYHKCHSKENSIRAYKLVPTIFCEEFGTENLEEITTEMTLSFLNRITEGKKRQTKRTRYSHLLAFFNFIKNHIDQEFVFIPQKLADRLKDYIRQKGIQHHQRIFPICYEASREMVAKAGSVVGIHLRPHDQRRHAATYASRSGVPIEIISKIILRHSKLSTTERYLGKIRDVEAMKWIDNLYG